MSKKNTRSPWATVFLSLTVITVVGLIAAFIAAFVCYQKWIVHGNLMDVRVIGSEKPNVTTKVVDRNGKEIGEIFVERRIVLPLSEIPNVMKLAVLAAEDKRFFQHHGVDFEAFAKANIQNMLLRKRARGASTITQQVVKIYNGNERSVKRKVQEMYLAWKLEKVRTKDDVLSFYLNQIYLGRQRYGVEAASQFYFGKSVKDIGLHEASLLASLPKAPEVYYRPDYHASWKVRQKYVLDQMVKNGWTTHSQAVQAQAEKIVLVKRHDGIAPEFLDLAEKELKTVHGKDLGKLGLTVSTTCDLDLQKAAREELEKGLNAVDAKNGNLPRPQGALILMDLRTREVVAMVGGYDQKRADFNRALHAKRQPGSTFKSIVWAAALDRPWTDDPETKFSPAMKLIDEEVEYEIPGSKSWAPKNHAPSTGEAVTMRDALARSLNTVSAQIAYRIGTDSIIEMASKLGIKSELRRPLGQKGALIAPLSISLGTSEVTLLEMVGAYATFASQGKFAEPVFMRQEKTNEPKFKQVVSPALATLMTSMLSSVVENGTGVRAKQLKRPAAGKTGTTQSSTDAWFIGYTPDYVAGVWVGNDNSKPLGSYWEGSRAALPIWIELMKTVHKGKPPVSFAVPPLGIVEQGGEIYLEGRVSDPEPEASEQKSESTEEVDAPAKAEPEESAPIATPSSEEKASEPSSVSADLAAAALMVKNDP